MDWTEPLLGWWPMGIGSWGVSEAAVALKILPDPFDAVAPPMVGGQR